MIPIGKLKRFVAAVEKLDKVYSDLQKLADDASKDPQLRADASAVAADVSDVVGVLRGE